MVQFTHGFLPVLRTASLLQGVFSKHHKNGKGAMRPLVCSYCWSRYMRIGITTYLNSSFSGIVISALELASPRLTCNMSTFRFANTSNRYVTLKPISTL